MKYVKLMADQIAAIEAGTVTHGVKIIPTIFNRFVDYHITKLDKGYKERNSKPTEHGVSMLDLDEVMLVIARVTDMEKDEAVALLSAVLERDSDPLFLLRVTPESAALNIVESKYDHMYFFNVNLLSKLPR